MYAIEHEIIILAFSNVFRIKCSPYFEMLGESIGLLVEDSDDVLCLAGSIPGVTESVGRHACVRGRGV